MTKHCHEKHWTGKSPISVFLIILCGSILIFYDVIGSVVSKYSHLTVAAQTDEVLTY